MDDQPKHQSPSDDLKKINALWGLIALLTLVFLPIAFGVPGPLLKILNAIGISLFLAFTVSYFTNRKIAVLTNFEIKDLIQKKFPKLIQIENAGLEKIVYENKMDAIGVDLASSDKLYIVMNDGKNFFTNNSGRLSERFKKENKSTIVILMSPESDSEKILNAKNKKSGEGYYARKIVDSTCDFINLHKDAPRSNHLDILYHGYSNSMSIVATENLSLIGLYRNSPGKSLPPPHFLFSNKSGGEHANIIEDIRNLISNSDSFYSSMKLNSESAGQPL